MRPIKKKLQVTIEVTPETKFRRMWEENSEGKRKYFSANRIIAKTLIEQIEKQVKSLIEFAIDDYETEAMEDFNEEYPFEDYEPEKYLDLVKEVKITWS